MLAQVPSGLVVFGNKIALVARVGERSLRAQAPSDAAVGGGGACIVVDEVFASTQVVLELPCWEALIHRLGCAGSVVGVAGGVGAGAAGCSVE